MQSSCIFYMSICKDAIVTNDGFSEDAANLRRKWLKAPLLTEKIKFRPWVGLKFIFISLEL